MPNGTVLYADAQCDAPISHTVEGGRVVAYTARDPGKPDRPNEDAALIVPLTDGGCVLAVADGMGGLPAGQAASRLALSALERCIAEAGGEGSSLRTAIVDGFEQANREILQRAPGSGATLVVAAIHDWTVRPFHVGDSELLVTGQRGRIKLQTLAHSPVAYAVEAGVLSESEARHHEERHVVTNALGSDKMRIELGALLALGKYDTVLLASDGLSDNLTVEEVAELVRRGPLDVAVGRLVEQAQRRMATGHASTPGKPDDLTVLAFRGDRADPRAAGRKGG